MTIVNTNKKADEDKNAVTNNVTEDVSSNALLKSRVDKDKKQRSFKWTATSFYLTVSTVLIIVSSNLFSV
jgi:hypothetical protein